MKELMTRGEFIAYAREVLHPESLECLYERISEHNGEVAAFGDSWPGALPQLHESVGRVKSIEARLAQLEGREPRDFRFRIMHPC